MKTIEIKDIGPVSNITIAVPDNGGICVLKGRNGTGKSRSLDAIEATISGRGKLNVRDGALRGEVSAFGAKITVGRSTLRSGELEVVSLEGRMSVAELVDPQIKSPDAADAKRIKALIQVSGSSTPTVEEFYDIVGGREEFDLHVGANAAAADDYVQMADRIKRALESSARKQEDAAENLEGRARGVLEQSAAPINVEMDASVLQSQLEASVKTLQSLQSQRDEHYRQVGKDKATREKITKLRESAGVLDLEGLTAEAKERRSIREEWESTIEKIRNELTAAQDQLAHSTREESEAIRKLESTLNVSNSIEQLESTLASEMTADIDEDDLANATEAVLESRRAIENGALARQAVEKRKQAEGHAAEAGKLRKKAASLRVAAQETDGVLSRLVGQSCSLLRVEHGRLVLGTRRGTTYYADLSHGERWKVALDIAIHALGENGVLVIPQDAWEGLDQIARSEIANHLAERGVVAITAECGLQEKIVAETFEPIAVGAK